MDEPERPVQRPDTETLRAEDEEHIIRSTNSLPRRNEGTGRRGAGTKRPAGQGDVDKDRS